MKYTKRFLLFFSLMALLLPVLSLHAQDTAKLPDLGGRKVTVAVENAYFPFNYIDKDTGKAMGWDYDMVTDLCQRINCVPDFVETSWDGMLAAVGRGEIDMAADGITITDERKQIVDFSDPYMQVDQVLLVRKGETRFKNADELAANKDFKLGEQPGTTNYDVAKGLVGENRIQAYDTFPVAVQALIAGDVDAVVMDNSAGQGYVGVNSDKLEIIGTSLRSDNLGFVFPKGSDLVAPFNAALAAAKADNSLKHITAKWFRPQLPDLAGKKITVAVENAYIPFNYINKDTNKAEGWDYDTLGEICKRLNCVPEFVETSWDGMIIAVSKGEYDMAADGITITDDRAQVVDFSIPYIQVDQSILVRVDENRFHNAKELAADTSLKVGSQPGTTNYEVAAKLVGESRIQAYETFPVAVQALIAGDVDAVIMDNIAGMGYVDVNADKVKIIGESLSSDHLGFIFPKGSTLRPAVDAALQTMMDDGTLDAIDAKWFKGTAHS